MCQVDSLTSCAESGDACHAQCLLHRAVSSRANIRSFLRVFSKVARDLTAVQSELAVDEPADVVEAARGMGAMQASPLRAQGPALYPLVT